MKANLSEVKGNASHKSPGNRMIRGNLNAAQTRALEILRSGNFFGQLRGVLGRVGLAGQEELGVGVFLIMLTRFWSNPLRLCIQQESKGNADYLVRRVGQLLPVGTVLGLSKNIEKSWRLLQTTPPHRVLYIPARSEISPGTADLRIEVHQNRLIKVALAEENGRVIKECQDIEKSVAVISAEYKPDWKEQCRWLTMELDTPAAGKARTSMTLDTTESEAWHEIQELLKVRSTLVVQMPEWEDVVMEKACEDELASQRMPTLFGSWKTMCLLRSFCGEDDCSTPKEFLRPSFEDLAVATAVLRRLFWEGCRLPSMKKVFDGIPVDEAIFSHPLTGKGFRYRRTAKPATYEPLL